MKNAKNTRLHIWELALLMALAAAILWGAASLSRQEDLGRKVIRLHVIANSDSPEDQALKLRVRDRVLARAQELLEQSADMAQAQEVLTSALPGFTARLHSLSPLSACSMQYTSGPRMRATLPTLGVFMLAFIQRTSMGKLRVISSPALKSASAAA